MLLYSLHKRIKDPITARTIENYLNSYIANAKIILKKIEEDVVYKSPEIAGTFGIKPKDGYLKHEAMNIDFTLIWLLDRVNDIHGDLHRIDTIQVDFSEAHQECIKFFIQKSGVQQCIKSWTSARELWISKRAEQSSCKLS